MIEEKDPVRVRIVGDVGVRVNTGTGFIVIMLLFMLAGVEGVKKAIDRNTEALTSSRCLK